MVFNTSDKIPRSFCYDRRVFLRRWGSCQVLVEYRTGQDILDIVQFFLMDVISSLMESVFVLL